MRLATVGSLALIVIALVASVSTALRFELHNDRSPTCFDLELTAADAEQGKMIQILYETNHSRADKVNDDGVFIPGGNFMPANLLITVHFPQGEDRVAINEGNVYMSRTVSYKRRRSYALRVVPFNNAGIFSLFKSNAKAKKGLVFGNYEVCFALEPSVGLAKFFKMALPEKGTVTVEVYASELYTMLKSDAVRLQTKGTESAEDAEVDEGDIVRTTATATGKTKSHAAHVDGQVATSLQHKAAMLTYIIEQATEGTRELRQRHDAFRATSESTFSRVWTWSLFTMGAMAFSFYRQFYMTRKTMKDKKLI